MQLAGQTILVTGASEGLGRAIALGFAREGAQLVLAARSWERLNKVATEVDRIGGEVLVVPCDVRAPAAVQIMVERSQKEFGHIDAVVTSAGNGLRRPFIDTGVDDWDDVFATLVRGTMLVAQAVLPAMIERKRGNIICLSAPLERIELPGFVTYTTAKYAVEGFIKTLAKEVRRYGVNVNGIHPGGFANTKMVQQVMGSQGPSALLEPSMIVAAAVALATQPPRGITGSIVDASVWNAEHGYSDETLPG